MNEWMRNNLHQYRSLKSKIKQSESTDSLSAIKLQIYVGPKK